MWKKKSPRPKYNNQKLFFKTRFRTTKTPKHETDFHFCLHIFIKNKISLTMLIKQQLCLSDEGRLLSKLLKL